MESGPFAEEKGWVICGVGIDGVYSNAPFGYEEEEGPPFKLTCKSWLLQ